MALAASLAGPALHGVGGALGAGVLLLATWRFQGYQPFGSPQGFAADAGAFTDRIRTNTAYILGYFFQRMRLFDLWGYVWILPLACSCCAHARSSATARWWRCCC